MKIPKKLKKIWSIQKEDHQYTLLKDPEKRTESSPGPRNSQVNQQNPTTRLTTEEKLKIQEVVLVNNLYDLGLLF